jgi:Predicted UDP-glucose 6-dehydrogenase
VGAGYVGMSISAALAVKEDVLILESNKEKIDRINSGKPGINDSDINAFFHDQSLSIKATENKKDAYHEADFIIICVPTDFDEESSSFDTSILERVLNDAITNNSDALVIIRSTIPVGYSEQVRENTKQKTLFFVLNF